MNLKWQKPDKNNLPNGKVYAFAKNSEGQEIYEFGELIYSGLYKTFGCSSDRRDVSDIIAYIELPEYMEEEEVINLPPEKYSYEWMLQIKLNKYKQLNDNTYITRVPGGWIYEFVDNNSTVGACFIKELGV